MSDTSKKASISVAVAIKYLTCIGMEVAIPMDATSPSDLVIRAKPSELRFDYGKWMSVQVKSFYQRGDGLVVNVSRTTGKGRASYQEDEVDLFLLVDGDSCHVVPYASLLGRKRLSLCQVLRATCVLQ